MSRERHRPRPPSEDLGSDDLSGASFDDESILQGYLARLMTMQDQRESWLEEADLRTAAHDLGLSDEDLARLQATTEAHRERGHRFVERRLWDEAVAAFRQAAALSPFDAALALELAEAYLGRWQASGAETDRAAADRYAHRALELDTGQEGAYEVLRQLKRQPIRSEGPPAAKVRLSMILLGLAMLLGLLLIAALLILVIL